MSTPTTTRPGDGSHPSPAMTPPAVGLRHRDPVAQVGNVTTPQPPPGPAGPIPRPGGTGTPRTVRSWPILLLALPAFVAIWSGWVGLGRLTGFGPVELLPGIWDGARINSAITLPIGMETYAAYALHVWLAGSVTERAARFAKVSAIGSLLLGAAGQIAYHLMTAAHVAHAPTVVTALVACLPVAVLGMGAALAHLVHDTTNPTVSPVTATPTAPPKESAPSADTTTTPVAPGTRPDQVKPQPATGTTGTTGANRANGRTTTGSPATGRTATGRTTTGRTTTGRDVARLRAKHPDMTPAEIARRLGVTDRTVRRHLNPPATNPTTNPATDPIRLAPTTNTTTTGTEDDGASRAA